MNINILCLRAARLIERGKLREVITALDFFGVRAVVQLMPADYKAFADKLTEIGG